jgi:hypothetical protein
MVLAFDIMILIYLFTVKKSTGINNPWYRYRLFQEGARNGGSRQPVFFRPLPALSIVEASPVP